MEWLEGINLMKGTAFWLVMLVIGLLLIPILTAAYNDDKTKGL